MNVYRKWPIQWCIIVYPFYTSVYLKCVPDISNTPGIYIPSILFTHICATCILDSCKKIVFFLLQGHNLHNTQGHYNMQGHNPPTHKGIHHNTQGNAHTLQHTRVQHCNTTTHKGTTLQHTKVQHYNTQVKH